VAENKVRVLMKAKEPKHSSRMWEMKRTNSGIVRLAMAVTLI
jgi:hypothetical protein